MLKTAFWEHLRHFTGSTSGNHRHEADALSLVKDLVVGDQFTIPGGDD
jgi:hypothetical protein